MDEKREIAELRKLLWLNHGHSKALYGDDGEMQCNLCLADFKRDSIEMILDKFKSPHTRAIEAWTKAIESAEGSI